MENQKYGVPAFISFFIPGLGQIIKGATIRISFAKKLLFKLS